MYQAIEYYHPRNRHPARLFAYDDRTTTSSMGELRCAGAGIEGGKVAKKHSNRQHRELLFLDLRKFWHQAIFRNIILTSAY